MIRSTSQAIITLAVLLIAVPALADPPDTNVEIGNIEERRKIVTEESLLPLSWNFGESCFTLSGLIEIEGSYLHPEGAEDKDDLRLATVQVSLDAELFPWLSGRVTGLWEDDDTEPMVIDEAVMTFVSPWKLFDQTSELYLGRQYIPFGNFSSRMISDPLTLELGETHTTALIFALENKRWRADIGTFEGSVDDNSDDGLDSWVLAVETMPREGVTLGASWISDLAESDAELVQDEGIYRDDVPGWSAFVKLQHGDFGLIAEYLAAVERFKPQIVEAGESLTGRRPQTWNLEFAWQAAERVQLAARYEDADDYQADVHRYGATASYGLCDFALLAAEYLHADADGEAPNHTFTAHLALEF
jgi:hypothetical protein